MIVCLCNRISDRQVRHQATAVGCSASAVHRSLGVTPKCGKCIPMMRDIVRESGGDTAAQASA